MVKPAPTVLFFGYYDDFAYFFAKVTHVLTANHPGLNAIFATGFVSGWWAWRNHAKGHSAVLLSFKVLWMSLWYRVKFWRHIPVSAFRGYPPKYLLAYDFHKTGEYRHIHTVLARICVFDKLFEKARPDYLVLSGDARVSSRICIVAARKYGCKIGFFEQGPFGTSYLDAHGVNANLTVPDLAQGQSNVPMPQRPVHKAIPERRLPFYRLADYVMSIIPGWPREYRSAFPWARLLKRKTPGATLAHPKAPYFLFALQVPEDANFIMHTDFANFTAALRVAAAALPSGTYLAVREHPKFKATYEPALYAFVEAHPQLYLQQGISGGDAISACQGLITLNSMMGIEALLYQKPVFVMGQSYYETVCTQADQHHHNFVAMTQFMAGPTQHKSEYAAWFLSQFFDQTAIQGHFRDSGVQAAVTFAEKISKSIW